MYVRQAKQFLRNAIEGFDERKYGFASVVDLLRAAGKEGVLRIERDRQGAVRVFPGAESDAEAVVPRMRRSMSTSRGCRGDADAVVEPAEENVAEPTMAVIAGRAGRASKSRRRCADADSDRGGRRRR